ncbi:MULTISPECIES: hypothetical protein [Rhodococcus]|uniref:hypothetical protein n=1 Tax=Rhodococcus TaxID=1827 RepID=UPI000F5B29D0|nr:MULTISPECIES: hypothetical protein [Rhodococcus]
MSAIVIVLAFMMMVTYFVLGGQAGRSGGLSLHKKSDSGENRFGRSFLAGFIVLSALVELAPSSGSTFASPIQIGIAVALFSLATGLFRGIPGVSLGTDLLYSVIGLIALVPALSELTAPNICGIDSNVPVRIAGVALFVVIGSLSGTAAFFLGGAKISEMTVVGLAWFGAIDIVLALTSPVGVASGPTPLILGLVAAVVLGGIIGAKPELGLLVVGTALGIIVLLTSASGITTSCDEVDSVGSVTMFVAFAVIFGLGRLTIGKLLPGRVR